MLNDTVILKKELTTDISYYEAYMKAKSINNMLKGNDPRFNLCLQLTLDCGTSLFQRNTFALKCDQWLFVFNRNDYHIYDFDKIEYYGQYKTVGIEVI